MYIAVAAEPCWQIHVLLCHAPDGPLVLPALQSAGPCLAKSQGRPGHRSVQVVSPPKMLDANPVLGQCTTASKPPAHASSKCVVGPKLWLVQASSLPVAVLTLPSIWLVQRNEHLEPSGIVDVVQIFGTCAVLE